MNSIITVYGLIEKHLARKTLPFYLVPSFDLRYAGHMKKKWQLLSPDRNRVDHLSKFLNCGDVLATILVNRNIVSTVEAERFLSPSLRDLRPPFAIKDMDRAADRIVTAIFNHEKILIFGDYDVDGITATVLYYEFLRSIGASVSYYIPHRIKEGYGLQTHHIHETAVSNRIELIITADCGISSHHAVLAANQIGIDVIVTDHHNVPETLPTAYAVVNPKRPDCTAGFEHLAGVGVAFNLLICIRRHLREKRFWKPRQEPNLKQLSDLVALGTVADQVPLLKENRILTKIGFEQIKSGNRPGIFALIKVSGRMETVDTDAIAFRLAPRLNAPGRLEHAKTAVELLTADTVESAAQLASTLNHMNMERRITEKNIIVEIEDYLANNPKLLNKNTLVLSNPKWHEGVLGIVASRLVDKLFCPVILISTKGDVGKGSARSIAGLDIYQAIKACESRLDTYGGHAMAAGLRIQKNNIERFQDDFETIIQEQINTTYDQPTQPIDYLLDLNHISTDLLDALDTLKPFGSGNPEPVFMAKDIKVLSQKIVGKNHRQMILQQDANSTAKRFRAIEFNVDPLNIIDERIEKMAFHLRWNYWNGDKIVQIVIGEI